MEDHRRSLRQATVGLTILGLWALGCEIFAAVTRGYYSLAPLWPLYLIAGFCLWRGSLRMAWWVAFFAALWMGVYLGAAAFLPVVIPMGILLPALRSYPLVMGREALPLVPDFALTVWIFLKVTALPVMAAAEREEGRRVKPVYGLLTGVVLAGGMAALFGAFFHSSVAQRARVEAARKTGPEYRYFVLGMKWEHPKQISATVIAYNAREAREVEVRWEE